MRKYILTVSLVTLFIFLAGCAKEKPPVEPKSTTVTTPQSTNTIKIEPEKPAPAVRAFSLTAKSWEFSPSVITVNEGDLVTLTITSTDTTHGFSLPDFNINENLTPGKTVTVEFTANKKGVFGFFCSVFCGEGHATMAGRLIVE